MPIIGSKGAESSGGFGQFAKTGTATYIEDVFSTYLYNGNSSTNTITNNIDLSTKGGLVWIKMRSAGYYPKLYDTSRGVNKALNTATNAAEATETNGITAFNSNGFTMDNSTYINDASNTFVSWTFRKQPKFFDVVTGSGGATVSHKLGVVPSCIIIKIYSGPNASDNWRVFHKDMPAGGYNGGASGISSSKGLILNSTAAAAEQYGGLTGVTSTEFNFGQFVVTGDLWVAYVFASNNGGFGLTGTDNVITCGTFSTTSGGASTAPINLGYEPQWVMTKNYYGGGAWRMFDTMRGLTVDGQNDALLQAQSYSAEIINSDYCSPTATGFTVNGHEGLADFIYIAIRRGPMKVPTLGTSVFSPNIATGGGSGSAGDTITTNFVTDLAINESRDGSGGADWFDRLRGNTPYLLSYGTSSELSPGSYYINFTNSNTSVLNVDYGRTSSSYVQWSFKRAPGFFDIVCYKGTGTTNSITHNLNSVPALMIIKSRSTGGSVYGWAVTYGGPTSATSWSSYNSGLSTTTTPGLSNYNYGAGAWTSTTIDVSSLLGYVNDSGITYVAYLFATCPGVSKVGTYTGSGGAQTINCGFTGGARFVLIKCMTVTQDWYVYDTARGMIAGTDPQLAVSATYAEYNGVNTCYSVTTGFQLQGAFNSTNAAGYSYLFLAIA